VKEYRMKLRSGLVAVACLAALTLSGCGNGKLKPIGQAPGFQVANVSGLPRPAPEDRVQASTAYLVGAFDTIEIEVYGVPDMKRSIVVDSSGTFLFPLAGEVQAAGLSPRQIADSLAGKLSAYVKNPQVTVNVTAMVSQNLTVDGQVARPGQFPVVGRQTLMRAIAVAGGTSEYARLDDVIIFRTVQGQHYVGIYNLGAIRRGNYEDPEVFPSDIVIVGDSPERRRFQSILTALPALLSPLVLLTQVVR
jgi:polysaccharide export outer membrane protein